MIKVRVGTKDNQKKFYLHKDIITHRSDFFKATCSERWNGNGVQWRTIELPEDDPVIFSIYMQCVYQDELVVGPKQDQHNTDNDWFLDSAIDAHILANKLCGPVSCNHIIDALIEVCDRNRMVVSLRQNRYNHLYKNTSEGSPLRRSVVTYHVLHLITSSFSASLASMPVEMMQECLEAYHMVLKDELFSRRAGRCCHTEVKDIDRCCNFHQHNEDYPPCDHDCCSQHKRWGEFAEESSEERSDA